jgi:hypothetical protein
MAGMHSDDVRRSTGGAPPLPPRFVGSAPLGGTAPVRTDTEEPSDRRELLLTAALLVLSIVAGAASLLPWRDFGRQFGAATVETGWARPDGSLGRGWVAVVLAVLVAAAGVLIAAERRRSGRVLAVLAGMALIGLAVGEWGFGAGTMRTGPGAGLWVELLVGVLVVLAVGTLSAADDERQPG